MDNNTVLVNPELAVASPAEGAAASLLAAITYAGAKTDLAGDEVIAGLKGNDQTIVSYFQYGLAQQAAEYLAGLDREVEGIYLYSDEATPEDEVFGAVSSLPALLLVMVGRKTKALGALVSALDRALCDAYVSTIGGPAPAHMLDVQLVTAGEVKNRQGLGSLFASLYHRPLPVWER